jgi:hypothetical protein
LSAVESKVVNEKGQEGWTTRCTKSQITKFSKPPSQWYKMAQSSFVIYLVVLVSLGIYSGSTLCFICRLDLINIAAVAKS